MSDNRPRHRRSLFWPIILILLGLYFLLNNLGVGEGLGSLLSLWPLLLVAIGLNGAFRGQGVSGPSFMIGVGALFLLTNYGVLRTNAWVAALQLWPIFIIAIGFDILVGRRSALLSILGTAVVLAIFAGGLWYSNAIGTPRAGNVAGEDIAQPLGDISSARVIIGPAVASLELDSTNDSRNLVEGTIQKWRDEDVTLNYSESGSRGTFTLESRAVRNVPFTPGTNIRRTWDLTLNSGVPLDLDVNMGVGDSEMDLSDLTLDEFDLDIGVGLSSVTLASGDYNANINVGVGLTTVVLPQEGQIRLSIEGGVGAIEVVIPDEMEARIRLSRGLSGFQIPRGYRQQGDVYTSPNYAGAVNRVDLSVNQGVGNIAIRER